MDYDIKKIIAIYLKWQKLNQDIEGYWNELNFDNNLKFRLINLPEVVSEGIICNIFNLQWNRQQNGNSADALTNDNKKVQIKASMNYENDLTSFGPKSKFDILIYCGIKEDKFFIHIFDNVEWVYNIMVSKKQSFQEQQKELRRPRFSIYKKWIKINNIKPNLIVNLREITNYYCVLCELEIKNYNINNLKLTQNFYLTCNKCR